MRKPAVFIASSRAGLPIALEFRSQLEPSVAPTLWSEGAFEPGQTVTESLTEVADSSDFAVFVLTADDTLSSLQGRPRVPRSNVIFEMGFLAGKIGLSRIFIVVADPDRTVMPSDLEGVMYLQLQTHQKSDLPASIALVTAQITKAIAEIGLRAEQGSELSSCFISYSWSDKNFAGRLRTDLKEAGVRCWLDAKEIKVGDSISERITRAMQAHDKVLLVLSRSSVRSSWVQAEIQKAFELERARDNTVLFPIRLDDAIFEMQFKPEFERLYDRLIIDFSEWQDRGQYKRAFSRLVRDLAITASVESEGRK